MTEALIIPPVDLTGRENKIIISVDSMVTTEIKKCAQSADFKYNLNIRKIDRREDSLWWGILMHEFMKSHYSDTMSNLRHLTDYGYSLIQDRAIDVAERFAANSEGVQQFLTAADLDNAIQTYRQYAGIFQFEGLQSLAVEQFFSKILYEDDVFIILMNGLIDLVVRHPSGQGILAYDHKTFNSWYDVNEIDNQFFTYAWALELPYLSVNRIGRKPTKNPPDRFIRKLLSFTPERIEEWRQEMIIWILSNYKMGELGIHLKNESSCDKFGGCQFKDICVANKEDREYIIQRDYELVPAWDPLDRDHTR